MTVQIDVQAARRHRNWSKGEIIRRMLWAIARPAFRYSPRPLWGWRNWLLRVFGAQVGDGVRVHPTVRVTMPCHLQLGQDCAVGDGVILYALGRIHIGERATVSQGAHLCAGTHDMTDPARPVLRLPVTIGTDAWVCADAFVGPGVSIGKRAVLGARAVAMRDLPDDHLGVGNPMSLRPRT